MESVYQLLITALTTVLIVAANELAKTLRAKPTRRKSTRRTPKS